MKEYLDENYVLQALNSELKKPEGWIEVPEGAELYAKSKESAYVFFAKDNGETLSTFSLFHKNEWYKESTLKIGNIHINYDILWQRPQQPESLPFIDYEVQSINDQYAEIEQVRQDMINHPIHYTQGKVECIDALESATIGKSGIEAVCVANVIKYLWRYEEKNGIEDVKKSQFYLNRLLATLENNNG